VEQKDSNGKIIYSTPSSSRGIPVDLGYFAKGRNLRYEVKDKASEYCDENFNDNQGGTSSCGYNYDFYIRAVELTSPSR
jgi:hypothetical protein